MNEMKILKWLGIICLAAGIVRMGMTPSAMIWGTDSAQELSFGYAACILMAIGSLAGFFAQSKETGALGFLSALGMATSNILTAALVFYVFVMGAGAAMPEGAVVAVTRLGSLISMCGGTLLFAIMTYRARVLPRWVAILFLLILFSMFLPIEDNIYFAFFWGLAYTGLGFCILTGRMTSRS